jgi:DNA polymerase-3 subunit epsilon
MRQVILDTETTGLDWKLGHRVIEIGCIEVSDRRITEHIFHSYVNPDRRVDLEAQEVHGLTTEFLLDKPRFPELLEEFLLFIEGCELVIHNASFDVGFLNNEIRLIDSARRKIEDYCQVVDSLALARQLHPGQRNSLDALAKRYQVDTSQRTYHGGLLDARILAEVYLAMTGGQADLSFDVSDTQKKFRGSNRDVDQDSVGDPSDRTGFSDDRFIVISASADEIFEHKKWLDRLGDNCVWRSDMES